MDKKQLLNYLKENPVFWSRLGFCYDPPLKNEEGKPLVFVENFDTYGRHHRAFSAAGVTIHTSILHSGWVGVNTYDYSLTDRVLHEIFRDNPEVYYIPRVKLNVPVDWCYENPEDVFVYYDGPRTKQGIQELVGTLQHDYLGYDAPNGYYTASTFVDPRPNVGGLIARQSFSSDKCLKDAKEALLRLMDHLEQSPYKDRILGYHIAYGTSGETILWGRISKRYGDYGITNTKAFYRWGLKKYQSRENLALAWEQPDISEENIKLPSPQERYGINDTVEKFFRCDKAQQICTDFDTFISQVNAEDIEYFARAVKEKSPDMLVGVFYGYFLHIDDSAYTGHLAMEQLLNSPYIDFFAAPKSYYRCSAGEPGGVLCPSQSVNHQKLWVDELDNRTHLAQTVEKDWISNGFRDTQTVFWREFAKNLSTDSGFWWMDLGGGWFDSDEIMAEIAKMAQTNTFLRKLPHQNESDILVLVDEECIQHMNISSDLRLGFMEDFLCEMHLTGCLLDVYRLKDLEWLDLAPYKLIVFAYTFRLTMEQRKKISQISSDKLLMFQYAAGILDENSCSLKNTKELTGITARNAASSPWNYPELDIVSEEQVECLLSDKNGNIKMASCLRENGGKNILNTQSYLNHSQLRKIVENAGCHKYTPEGNTVYGDNRFLGVFSTKAATIPVKFRRKGNFIDVLSGKTWEDTDELCLQLSEKSAAVLLHRG